MHRALLFLALALAIASATKYEDCGSKFGTVTKVDVNDCPDTADTCILSRGTKKNLSISFNSKSESKTVKAVVHGVIKGVPLPFSLPKSDGCKTGLDCPLKNGQDYTYANVLNIRNSYPPLYVKVRWELRDDNGEDIVCVEIPCEIQ